MDNDRGLAASEAGGFQLLTDDGGLLYGEVVWSGVGVGATEGQPVVVLCHCWTGRRQTWQRVADRLTTQGLTVVSYDHRGHGASSTGPGDRSIERLSRDLGQVLDHLDLDQVVLVGHSLGGMVAMQRVLEADRRVVGLALVSTSAAILPRFIRPVAARLANVLRAKLVRRILATRVGAAFVRPAFGRRPDKAAVQASLESLRGTDAGVVAGQLRAVQQFDVVDQLDRIHLPTAVVVGRRDLLTPLRSAKIMTDGIAGSRLSVLAGAGHMLPYERPGEVSDIVCKLVERVGKLSGPADLNATQTTS